MIKIEDRLKSIIDSWLYQKEKDAELTVEKFLPSIESHLRGAFKDGKGEGTRYYEELLAKNKKNKKIKYRLENAAKGALGFKGKTVRGMLRDIGN